MNRPLLDLQAVGYAPARQPIVAEVTLQVRRGERLALIGPNGAGKSTLFQLIGGMLAPTAGRIVLDGRRIDGCPPDRIARCGVGRMFQSPQMFPGLSVADNLRCALLRRVPASLLRRVATDSALQRDAARWIGDLGLSALADRPAQTLDHASLRTLELGMALAGEPVLLLLDEPTAGIDRPQAARLLDLVAARGADRTLLVIEHDLDAVFRLATRVVVLHQGRVLADGTPSAVRADPRVQQVYLGMDPGAIA